MDPQAVRAMVNWHNCRARFEMCERALKAASDDMERAERELAAVIQLRTGLAPIGAVTPVASYGQSASTPSAASYPPSSAPAAAVASYPVPAPQPAGPAKSADEQVLEELQAWKAVQ